MTSVHQTICSKTSRIRMTLDALSRATATDEQDHQFVVPAGRGGKVWTVFPDVSEAREGAWFVEEASTAESGALHSADCSYTKQRLGPCWKLTHQNVSPVFSASGDISQR